jgi:DNA-binding transcriptional MerR regulator
LLDSFFTPEALAAEIGVHVRTLRKFSERGEGPPETRLGRKVLYAKDSVIEWLKAREQRRGRRR